MPEDKKYYYKWQYFYREMFKVSDGANETISMDIMERAENIEIVSITADINTDLTGAMSVGVLVGKAYFPLAGKDNPQANEPVGGEFSLPIGVNRKPTAKFFNAQATNKVSLYLCYRVKNRFTR